MESGAGRKRAAAGSRGHPPVTHAIGGIGLVPTTQGGGRGGGVLGLANPSRLVEARDSSSSSCWASSRGGLTRNKPRDWKDLGVRIKTFRADHAANPGANQPPDGAPGCALLAGASVRQHSSASPPRQMTLPAAAACRPGMCFSKFNFLRPLSSPLVASLGRPSSPPEADRRSPGKWLSRQHQMDGYRAI